MKTAIVALGGNALLRGNQKGTIEEQIQNATETLEHVVSLIEEGYNLVITHGNGPQVGNILMRNDAGEEKYGIPQMPLDICVADSQGGIGYMLEQVLINVLREKGINKPVVTLVTQVEVDPNDPAFQNPTKQVGKIYSKEEADRIAEEKGWLFKPSPKKPGGWRRVVPSPWPKSIVNLQAIEDLLAKDFIVIAVGGGGVPVARKEDGKLYGVEAVIDKDRASSVLASDLKADEFYILTDVPYVYINFNTPEQKALEELTISDALRYMEQGAFGEGDMKPKIEACINYIRNGGKRATITESSKLHDKKYGTKILPD